jgi:hypothetical protein
MNSASNDKLNSVHRLCRQNRRELLIRMNDVPKNKPKPNFFRFSLRSLLILMLIVAGPLGWKLHKAKRQQEVVAWVEEMGGSVHYAFEIDDAGAGTTIIQRQRQSGWCVD